MNSISSCCQSFHPINQWRQDTDSPVWVWNISHEKAYMYVIDLGTGDKYLNEEPLLISIKCFVAAVFTPIIHPFAIIINLIIRIIKLVSFFEFWKEVPEELEYNLKNRFFEYGKDFLRILIAPFILLLLELSALYGIFAPRDGRKLYASFECGFYGRAILGGCFQPNEPYHLFGGDINKAGAW